MGYRIFISDHHPFAEVLKYDKGWPNYTMFNDPEIVDQKNNSKVSDGRIFL